MTETSYATVNTVLHYSYVVTNTGNVILSGPFTVTDDKSTDESCPATPATLAPGESFTCTATYTVTQADLNAGSVTNIASAHSLFGTTPVNSPTDTETVNAAQIPQLSIVKTQTSKGPYVLENRITYNITVTNTGNVTLTNVTVSDNSVNLALKSSL